MKRQLILTIFTVLNSAIFSYGATITWTNGAGDSLWGSTGNWSSASIPTSADAAVISGTVTDTLIGIDTGASKVGSLTFSAGTDLTEITVGGSGDTLQINGALTNNSGNSVLFSLPMIAGASAVWTGALNFQSKFSAYDDGGVARTVTFAGAATFQNEINLVITSSSVNSALNISTGSLTFSSATINISLGAYTPIAGNSWDFSNSNFSGATLGSLPTLGGGLTWNTSNFLTTGVLTVVPEPSTWALLAASLTAVMILRRRRSA